MSKELNYLEDILKNEPLTLNKRMIIECIKEKIQRLESIDNAKASEALKCLKKNSDLFDEIAQENPTTYKDGTVIEAFLFKTNTIEIERALIKAQEQEKVLNELLLLVKDLEPTFKRKGATIYTLVIVKNIKDYFYDNASDLLKRYIDGSKS